MSITKDMHKISDSEQDMVSQIRLFVKLSRDKWRILSNDLVSEWNQGKIKELKTVFESLADSTDKQLKILKRLTRDERLADNILKSLLVQTDELQQDAELKRRLYQVGNQDYQEIEILSGKLKDLYSIVIKLKELIQPVVGKKVALGQFLVSQANQMKVHSFEETSEAVECEKLLRNVESLIRDNISMFRRLDKDEIIGKLFPLNTNEEKALEITRSPVYLFFDGLNCFISRTISSERVSPKSRIIRLYVSEECLIEQHIGYDPSKDSVEVLSERRIYPRAALRKSMKGGGSRPAKFYFYVRMDFSFFIELHYDAKPKDRSVFTRNHMLLTLPHKSIAGLNPYCSYCKRFIEFEELRDIDSRTCPVCSHNIIQIPRYEYCRKCSAYLNGFENFCTSCATSITDEPISLKKKKNIRGISVSVEVCFDKRLFPALVDIRSFFNEIIAAHYRTLESVHKHTMYPSSKRAVKEQFLEPMANYIYVYVQNYKDLFAERRNFNVEVVFTDFRNMGKDQINVMGVCSDKSTYETAILYINSDRFVSHRFYKSLRNNLLGTLKHELNHYVEGEFYSSYNDFFRKEFDHESRFDWLRFLLFKSRSELYAIMVENATKNISKGFYTARIRWFFNKLYEGVKHGNFRAYSQFVMSSIYLDTPIIGVIMCLRLMKDDGLLDDVKIVVADDLQVLERMADRWHETGSGKTFHLLNHTAINGIFDSDVAIAFKGIPRSYYMKAMKIIKDLDEEGMLKRYWDDCKELNIAEKNMLFPEKGTRRLYKELFDNYRTIVCPSCNQVTPKDNFCAHCGHDLRDLEKEQRSYSLAA